MTTEAVEKQDEKTDHDLPCRRFVFAISDNASNADRLKRRKAVVRLVDEWASSADIVAEFTADRRLYVVVETNGPVGASAAHSFASEIPRYVPGSFRVSCAR